MTVPEMQPLQAAQAQRTLNAEAGLRGRRPSVVCYCIFGVYRALLKFKYAIAVPVMISPRRSAK